MLSNILKTNSYKKRNEPNGYLAPHDIVLLLEYSKGFP